MNTKAFFIFLSIYQSGNGSMLGAFCVFCVDLPKCQCVCLDLHFPSQEAAIDWQNITQPNSTIFKKKALTLHSTKRDIGVEMGDLNERIRLSPNVLSSVCRNLILALKDCSNGKKWTNRCVYFSMGSNFTMRLVVRRNQ